MPNTYTTIDLYLLDPYGEIANHCVIYDTTVRVTPADEFPRVVRQFELYQNHLKRDEVVLDKPFVFNTPSSGHILDLAVLARGIWSDYPTTEQPMMLVAQPGFDGPEAFYNSVLTIQRMDVYFQPMTENHRMKF